MIVLKSMAPRSVRIMVEELSLWELLSHFFVEQGWDVVSQPPCDLVVTDARAGLELMRTRRRAGDDTPCLVLRGPKQGSRPGRLSHALRLDAPFTPDRLRDACGALLRRKIKLVLKRRAS